MTELSGQNDRISPANETSEQKVERLLAGVKRAEFASFQEYSYVSTRSGNGFECVAGNDLRQEDDLVPYHPDDIDVYHNRPSLIIRSIARVINLNLLTKYPFQGSLKNNNELYCVVGEMDGKIIVQGGGRLHSDFGRRPGNPSCFKLIFNTKDAASEYCDWLKKDPNGALGAILRKAIGQYDKQGNFKETLLPLSAEASIGKFLDPFSFPIKKVEIKDLGALNQLSDSS